MAESSKELHDIWERRGDVVVAAGDAPAIDTYLADKLTRIAVADGGWRSLYRHRDTGRYWELAYPKSELHGGGPRVLRELDIGDQSQWS